MTDQHQQWEIEMQNIARHFPYPQTPELSKGLNVSHSAYVNFRRWAQAVAIFALVLIGLMAVPGIRAAVLEFLRIGAVEIHFTDVPMNTAEPTPLASALDLPGETTLEAARERFNYPIPLPSYPLDLGAPSHVYAFDGVVVLVWLDQDGRDWLVLNLIPSDLDANKYFIWEPEYASVNGQPAVWLANPHLNEFFGREMTVRRMIAASVLVWEQGDMTYRLETDLPMDEAIRIAESLE